MKPRAREGQMKSCIHLSWKHCGTYDTGHARGYQECGFLRAVWMSLSYNGQYSTSKDVSAVTSKAQRDFQVRVDRKQEQHWYVSRMPFQMAQSLSGPWRGELDFENVRVEQHFGKEDISAVLQGSIQRQQWRSFVFSSFRVYPFQLQPFSAPQGAFTIYLFLLLLFFFKFFYYFF